jgi:hypothetical protein
MLHLDSGRCLRAIGTRLGTAVGHLVAALGELARHQLPSHLVPNLAGQFLQLNERASSSQPLMFLPRKPSDDP